MGVRVGDVGTEIILNITDNGVPINLLGGTAKIEIMSAGEVKTLEATVGESSISYIGKKDDNLWEKPGAYIIQGIITWGEDRKFTTDEIRIIVT